MTDPTGGRGALDWLGIADRCQAACTSKEWLVASESAALWQHWTFHMDGTRVYDRYYGGWRENPSHMPHHGQRANLLRLPDLPRLSPMLLARLQRHTTCVVMDFHQWAFADQVNAESPINRAWRVFSGLDFPRLQRVQFSFDIRGTPQIFDFGDAALPLPPQQSPFDLTLAFPFARNFAPLLAAKTLVVDRLPGLGQSRMFSDEVIEPFHLSLEGILRIFRAVENFSMLEAFDSPIGAARYGEEPEQRPALSHASHLVGVDLLQQFTSLGWIYWGALKVQMQQPASMNNLVSLGISIGAGTGELFEEIFKGLQRFAPSLEFLAIEADRLTSLTNAWTTIGYEEFEEVPPTVRHLVLGFDPAHFHADLDPNILCENLLDSCTLHMQASENPPRGKTWTKPPPYVPGTALRPPPRPKRGWQTLSYSVDLRDQFIPPDSFFSCRGRLSADELAERRRRREEEDY